MIFTLTRYAFTAALRDRVILSFLALIIVSICLSLFMGSAATIEKEQFSVVFSASGLRLVGVLSVALFVVFYVRHAFENKDVDFLLSRPISRPAFILAHSIAFSSLAFIMGLCVLGSVVLSVPHIVQYGHFLWGLSVTVEFIIIANVALFFSMVLPSATMSAISVAGFYVFSRLIGQVLGILDFGTGVPFENIMNVIVQVISIFVPRLDLIGQTSWLIYGANDGVGLGFILLQGIFYSGLLLLAAMIDLVRRQF